MPASSPGSVVRALPLLWSVLVGLGCASTLDKAQAAHQRGAWDDAQTLYTKVQAESSAEPAEIRAAQRGLADLWVARAQARVKTDPRAAEAHFREALAVVPVHDAALTALVRLLRGQGRLQDASDAVDAAAATGKCSACSRLAVVLQLERAEQAFAAGTFDVALKHYQAAHAQRPQPGVAVAIAATQLRRGALPDSEAALVAAAPLMPRADASTTARFSETRAGLLAATLTAGDFEGADRIAAFALSHEPAADATERALQVARAVDEGGQESDALARYEALLATRGPAALAQASRHALSDRIAAVYAGRGTAHLHAGDAQAAQAAFEQAIALRADDWLLKLQRVLAMSGTTGAAPALASLQQVPPKTAGLAHVRAILWSLRVTEQLADGDAAQAREALSHAHKAHPDLPEVHLAAAHVMAGTPSDELAPRDRKALLGTTSLVRYDHDVFRYAEALAELAWVRTEMADRKADYPFTAPWLAASAAALQTSIAATYPYAVEFQPEPEPVVLLANPGPDFVEVSVQGPSGFAEELGIPPGDAREIVPPDSGLLRLRIGRSRRVFYAEGYAKVTVRLP